MRNINLIMLSVVLVLIVGMALVMVGNITGKASEELAYFYSLEAVNEFNSYMARDLTIDDALAGMFAYFEKTGIKGYVVDSGGVIISDSGDAGSDNINIKTVINDPGFEKFIDLYLNRPDGRPEIVKLSNGLISQSNYNYAAVAPIADFNWSVVAFYNSNLLFGSGALILLIVIPTVIFLGYVLIRSAILRRFVFSPLGRLSVSVAEANENNTVVYGSGRADEIGELARNIQRAWENIGASQQRMMLMLDATPLACRLMKRTADGKYELFECNEESVKLFKFKTKREFIERYFEIYPEYQPNGKNSAEEGRKHIDEAYKNGECFVKNFYFKTTDGEFIPSEVKLVRVKYGDEYVIAGYTRDMREHERMMRDIKNRDKLLNMGNSATRTLLATGGGGENIENALIKSLEIVGRAIDGDRVQIWRNEITDGEPCFVHLYEWLSDIGKQKTEVPIGQSFSYNKIPKIKKYFADGGYLNGAVSDLPEEELRLLKNYDIKTIVIIPLFIKEEFWGFFRIDDCAVERTFTDDEITLLRSVSQMLVSALNRDAQAGEIREAHDRVRVLLDKMPFACHLWDKNYNIIECNEANARLFGVSEKDILMDRFAEFAPEYQPNGQNSLDMAFSYVREAFEKGRAAVDEFIHKNVSGEHIPIEITLIRIPYEGDHAVAVYLRDLREQKAMIGEIERKSNLLGDINKSANILLKSGVDEFEENLQLSMKIIGESVDADRMCIWKNSVKNGKLYCTLAYEWVSIEKLRTNRDIATEVPYEGNIPTWERLLSRGDCINTLTRELSPIEHARMAMHGIKSIFVAPVFVNSEFWGFVGCDNCHNENIFSEDMVSVLRSGSLLIAHALMRNDMTQNLRAAAAELETALSETRKANSAKSDFLASMSHEMRTPLNAVIGLSGLCLEKDGLDEDVNSNLEKIYNSGDMLLSIVNDILDISKIEAGKMELVEVRYDVPSLINDAVTQNILRIGEKPIRFILDIGTDLFAVLYGDELRVKQIINNLLSNAIKYTDKGSVKLSVHCEQDGDIIWVTAKISDTGKGIKPGDIEKLFKDYSQLDLESNRKTEGTGLGLPISKSLAEMMGGTITVESEYGKGSVFTVKLAQKFVSNAHIGEEVVNNLQRFCYSDGKRARNTKIKHIKLPYARVLVVDDNLTNLDVAKGLMKPYGMQIDCVTDGEQAVDIIRNEKIIYNAVFMDHMMPGIDGIEATRIIREEIGTDYAKNIPIIALTANAIAGNEAMFLTKGFQAFISKPIEIGRLDTVIRHYVRDKSKEPDAADQDINSEPDLEINENENENESELMRKILEGAAIPGLDISSGVERFYGDAGTYLNVLRSYADNTIPLLEKTNNPEKDNLHSYAVLVHGIKGASRGICANIIGDLAERLEREAKAGNYKFVSENNQELNNLAGGLINEIKNFLGNLASSKPKPKKNKPDDDILKALLEACESFDTDNIDALIKELDSYEYESGGDFITGITQNANSFKYKEIIDKLTAIL